MWKHTAFSGEQWNAFYNDVTFPLWESLWDAPDAVNRKAAFGVLTTIVLGALLGGGGVAAMQWWRNYQPTIVEPEIKPFTLSSLRVEGRIVRSAIRFDPAHMPPGDYPLGLLAVYCGKEDFDPRLIGDVTGQGYGATDPELGAQVIASTLHDPSADEDEAGYLGAWWYGRTGDIDWTQQRQVGMQLAGLAGAGRLEPLPGGSYLIVAMVAGRIGHGNLVLLSEPVRIPYEPPLAPQADTADFLDPAASHAENTTQQQNLSEGEQDHD